MVPTCVHGDATDLALWSGRWGQSGRASAGQGDRAATGRGKGPRLADRIGHNGDGVRQDRYVPTEHVSKGHT